MGSRRDSSASKASSRSRTAGSKSSSKPRKTRDKAGKEPQGSAKKDQAPPTKAAPAPERPAGSTRLTRSEANVLLKLEDLLKKRIVGKEDAVSRVAKAIRTRRADLDLRPNRPDGSFLLVGPSGVGKNEFAYAVAEVLLGDEKLVTALDMNDYQDDDAVERLISTPIPGRTDFVMEGTLTGAVRANPRCVILLRGLEKAHPAVQRLLYNILDQGVFHDAEGPALFQQSIIFATTLFTDEDLRPYGIGFTRSNVSLESHLRELLKKTIQPEVVNAFNEVIFLGKLTTEDVRNIARYKVEAVLARLRQQRRSIKVSDRVLEAFIREAEVQEVGAGRLNRTLEEKLFHPLAKYILEHRGARKIHVDLQGNRLIID